MLQISENYSRVAWRTRRSWARCACRLAASQWRTCHSVLGKQGRERDKYQGYSPNKTRRTKLFKTPREAAIAFAKLMKDTENDPTSRTLTSRRLRWVRVACCASLPAPRWRVLGCI